jgi:hypothetical protein
MPPPVIGLVEDSRQKYGIEADPVVKKRRLPDT